MVIVMICTGACQNAAEQKSKKNVVVVDSLQLRHTDSLYRRAKDLFGERKFAEAKVLFDQVDTMFLSQQRYSLFLLAKVNKATNLRGLEATEDEILLVLKEALSDVKNIPSETIEIGSVYNWISASYIRTEEYSDAKYYALKALEVFDHPSHVNNEKRLEEALQSYDRLSQSEAGLFNYEKAEAYYIKQLNLEFSSTEKTRTLTNVFAFYENTEQFDKAQVVLDTVAWEKRLANTSFYDNYVFQITKLDFYLGLEKYEEALTTAKKLDDFINDSPYGAHFTNWYLDQRMAQIYLEMGNYDEVIKIVDNIKLGVGEERLNSLGSSPQLLYKSQALYNKGNIEDAKMALQEAINLHLPKELETTHFFDSVDINAASIKTKLIGKLMFKAQMCSELYELDADQKHLQAALQNYQLVHQLMKEVGAASDEDQFIEEDSFKNFYEVFLKDLHKQWSISKSESLFYEALTVSDEAKNISVLKELKQVKRNKLFQNIPEELRTKQLHFEATLDSISRAITIALDPAEGIRVRDSIIVQFDAFKGQLKMEYPKYYALLYGSQEPLKNIIVNKFSDYNLLEYFVGEDHIFVFNVNDGALQFDKIQFTTDLKQHLDQLINGLRDPSNSQYKASIAAVYEAILAKYDTTSKKLVLILDGQLYALPFEVLTVLKSEMLLQQPTLRLNSISQSEAVVESFTSKALAFAPFANSGTEGRNKISNSLDEAEYVKNTFGGDVKLDKEATKEAFITNASSFPIVHLATHSEVNKNVPLRSAIYFAAQQGESPSEYSLELQELYNMNLNTHLVTLSSCETGLGKLVKGKGVQSISNAFGYAGVTTTVMSLWKVPDKQTSQIMMSFYNHLGKGEAMDKALHNAKMDYLKATTDANLRHPYYWAGFVISGDVTPLRISTPAKGYVAWGALILGTLGLGLFYFRRRKKAA